MTLAAVLLLAAILVFEAVRLVLDVLERRRPVIDGYVGRTLTVHLRGEEHSVEGVLAVAGRDAFELRQAKHLGPKGNEFPIDGAAVVERRRLDYFQVLDPPRSEGDG